MSQKQWVFVFEVCAQCKTHSWNTRHDEAKYMGFFTDLKAAIESAVPGAQCVLNKVPKAWYEKEVYCQLIPNDDDNNPHYDILPRIGAFEISTVIDNVDILLYSKMMSLMWPHVPSVVGRIQQFDNDAISLRADALRAKYYTSGRQVRASRSPSKRASMGGSMRTTGGANAMAEASAEARA